MLNYTIAYLAIENDVHGYNETLKPLSYNDLEGARVIDYYDDSLFYEDRIAPYQRVKGFNLRTYIPTLHDNIGVYLGKIHTRRV